MAATFLEYLTQPNPQPIVHTKEGSSTRTGTNYGPDRCVKWEDFTWENLRATLGNVLRQPMPEPRIADASEVPPEKRDIFREDSVTQLAVAWNEPVLRHAFGGTHAALCRKKPANSFQQGKIHFAANTGRGNTKNHKGEEQEPDWCVYQEVPGFYPFYPNIVPGDSKSSKKWKSEWVNSKKPMLRKRAQHVMTQITKYMWESRTRYGFIISEEELVLVRLSVFVRKQVAGAGVENLNRSFENFDDEQRVGSSDDDADQISNPPSNASFAESSRETGLQVEYTVVPWEASGTDILTMNLALWWLPVLAVQGHIIKRSGTYTSLGKHTRGGSPVLQLDQAELDMFDKVYGETSHLRKRKAAEDRDEDQLGIDSCASDPSSDTDEPGPAIHHSYKRRSTRGKSGSSSQLDQGRSSQRLVQHSVSSRYPTRGAHRQSKRRRRRSKSNHGIEESSQETDPIHLSYYLAE